MNPHSQHIRHTGRFVDWMTDVPAQKIPTRSAAIPTNRAVRADAELREQYPPLRAAAASTKAYRLAGLLGYAEVSRAIHTNVQLALRGQLEPAEALLRAQRDCDRALRAKSG
ncbi:hypothetical protein [Frankia sp. QA3]|uniref:hypothetical protein n=1 Tax=Frankia sp. QA3 TaxID=710111 RepID=UPI000303AB6D|nr:hypothetical protein [Frankia sp. QA3]